MLGLFSGLSIKEKKEDDEIISSKETKNGGIHENSYGYVSLWLGGKKSSTF